MFSIIIPTFNEVDQIAQTISTIFAANIGYEIEIIVIDGGSTDTSLDIAKQCGAIAILSKRKGRAAQMNLGASVAKYEILYFLHADSFPPNNFTATIFNSYDSGAKSGCFRLQFDYDHWFLKANAWCTRFNLNAIRFGDQSLFVTKEKYKRSNSTMKRQNWL